MDCAYVVWVDSVHQDAWNPADSIQPAKPEISVGILVRDDPEFVTLALSYAPDTSEYGQVISIPRIAIKEFQVFTKPSKRKPRAVPTPKE